MIAILHPFVYMTDRRSIGIIANFSLMNMWCKIFMILFGGVLKKRLPPRKEVIGLDKD